MGRGGSSHCYIERNGKAPKICGIAAEMLKAGKTGSVK